MDPDDFADRYPVLFHATGATAWPSIKRRGLLSTAAIVDLFDPPPAVRRAILAERRRTSIALPDDGPGAVIIRDQTPLKFLDECLHDGVEPRQFLDALNSRVFFWLSEDRVRRLVNARAVRDRPHLVLRLDTAAVLRGYRDVADLAPFNTGAAFVPPPHAPRRGPDVFVPFGSRPFGVWTQLHGKKDPIAEFTVPHAMPDAARFVVGAEIQRRDHAPVPVEVA